MIEESWGGMLLLLGLYIITFAKDSNVSFGAWLSSIGFLLIMLDLPDKSDNWVGAIPILACMVIVSRFIKKRMGDDDTPKYLDGDPDDPQQGGADQPTTAPDPKSPDN